MEENTKKAKKKERRISLFLGYDKCENHFVDEKIYGFFNKIPNKANLIKNILYEYAINNSGGNIVTATVTPNVTENVTLSEQLDVTESVTLNVTEKVTEKVTEEVTEKEQLNVTVDVTEEEQEQDSDIEFEIKEVVKKDTNEKNNDDFDLNNYMNQIENLNYDSF